MGIHSLWTDTNSDRWLCLTLSLTDLEEKYPVDWFFLSEWKDHPCDGNHLFVRCIFICFVSLSDDIYVSIDWEKEKKKEKT